MDRCKFIVVGDDTADNFRLGQALRRLHGADVVDRVIELGHLERAVDRNSRNPTVICIDLLGFPLEAATSSIASIREHYPKAVFTLYLDYSEFASHQSHLSEAWQLRLGHYYKVFREDSDEMFEPTLRAAIRPALSEALRNMDHEPVCLTHSFTEGLVGATAEDASGTKPKISFVSYSKLDWEGFVSRLVEDLGKDSHQLWIDQQSIVGGEDWMDAVGAALDICDSLLLVVSPRAMASKYVKMEYHHFLNQEKLVIPIIFEPVGKLPFNLSSLHHLDFAGQPWSQAYENLVKVLNKQKAAEG